MEIDKEKWLEFIQKDIGLPFDVSSQRKGIINLNVDSIELPKKPHLYILQGKQTIPVFDVVIWGRWFETADRWVKQAVCHGARISTVFLGLDHAAIGQTKPMLFETMIFGGRYDQWQERCSTWEEAVIMHDRVYHDVRYRTLDVSWI